MKLIYMRQQEVLTWQDEQPPVVRRRAMKADEESRSLIMIFDNNKILKVLEDVSKRTVVNLLGKYCDQLMRYIMVAFQEYNMLQ